MHISLPLILHQNHWTHQLAATLPVEISKKRVLRSSQKAAVSSYYSLSFSAGYSGAFLEDVLVDFGFSLELDDGVAVVVGAYAVLLSVWNSRFLLGERGVSEVIKVQVPDGVLALFAHVWVSFENGGKLLLENLMLQGVNSVLQLMPQMKLFLASHHFLLLA
jgi:hypothetical protein